MKSLTDLIKEVLYYSGFYKLYSRLKISCDHRLLILMYHDLVEDNATGTDKDIRRGRLSKSQFAAHLAVLKKYYRVVSVEQAIDEIERKGTLQRNSVAITFDDGYASTYGIAYPLLKEYKFPATVYLITNWINRKMTLWWEDLADMVRKCDCNKLSVGDGEKISDLELGKFVKDLAMRPELKEVFFRNVEAVLREKDENKLLETMHELKTMMFRDSEHTPAEVAALSWEEIKEMAAGGIEFGSHTCSHMSLANADINLVEKEVAESKKEIEKHLGKKVKGFAYPYGMELASYHRIEPVLKRHGFEYACTAFPGNNCHLSNRYALRRTMLPPETSKGLLGRILFLDLIADNRIPKSAKLGR